MRSDRVVSAVARESASVRELRERLAPAAFAEHMRAELRPYFRNESAIDTIISLETHIWEFGVILDMKAEAWFNDALRFFIQQFNRAKELHQASVQQSLTALFPRLSSALARYSEAFHLENLDSSMPPHLLSRSAFRQLGDVLEGCLLPFIRQVYSLLQVAGSSGLHHNPCSGSFGSLVSDLCTLPVARNIYQDLLRGVPVHQWRNIAYHSSYTCVEDAYQIECVYGLRNEQKTVILSSAELLDVLRQTDRLFALHKIGVGFFTADNIDLLRAIDPPPSVTKDTVTGTLLSFFEAHALQVIDFDTASAPWAVLLRDTRGRPEDEVRRLLTHAARFTAVRPDVTLRFYLEPVHDRSCMRGELRKGKPNKTSSP